MLPKRSQSLAGLLHGSRLAIAASALVFTTSLAALGTTERGNISVTWDPDPGSPIAGYKLYYGTESRNYDQVIDVGMTTTAELPDLTVGLLYYCAVTSYNNYGTESGFSVELPVAYLPQPAAPTAEGNQLILIENPEEAVAGFEVPAGGSYTLWCRLISPTASAGSLPVLVDMLPQGIIPLVPDPWVLDQTADDGGYWTRLQVAAGGPAALDLTSGVHTLHVLDLPPGFILDRFVLSADSVFIPSDDLPRTQTLSLFSQPEENLLATEGTGITLAAVAVATSPISYQWFFNGKALPDQNSPALRIDPVSLIDAGNYILTVSTESDSKATAPSYLAVAPLPPGGDGASPPSISRFTFSPGHSVTFELSGGIGLDFIVWASCDLQEWSPIGTRANEDGTITITDPDAEGCPQRYYRLETPGS